MVTFLVPEFDHEWPRTVAMHIRDAQDGDVIKVSTEAQCQLAERAKARMCPDKQITILVKTQER